MRIRGPASAVQPLAIDAHVALRRRAKALRQKHREERLRDVRCWLGGLHRQVLAMKAPGGLTLVGG